MGEGGARRRRRWEGEGPTDGIHPTVAEEFIAMREPVAEPEKQAAE